VLINASVQQLTANDYTSHLQDATTVRLKPSSNFISFFILCALIF